MARADEKVITPPSAAQRQQGQQYVEPEGRRPPYFGEREPVAWALEGRFQAEGSGHADADQTAIVKISGSSPLEPRPWIEAAVQRMGDDRPYEATEAGRRLAPEMYEAYRRGQCAAAWTADSIDNKLVKWGLWPRRRHSRPR